MDAKKRIVIIGGGIAGVTAAYYLQKAIQEEGLPLEYVLIEGSERLGGKVQTLKKDGFVIEKGPDSFLARKKSAARLVKEVGLEQEIVYNTAGQAFVMVGEKLHPMPGGSIMGVPTQLGPFLTSGLFSPFGKIRAAADLVLPKSKVQEDQSLGEFFRRRLGSEVVENLIEPLLSGIYAGDIDRLSLMATFPQFYEVEQKHRSLIVGMKHTRPKKKSDTEHKPQGIFQTITSGLESLFTSLEQKLDPDSIKKGIMVKDVKKNKGSYSVLLSNNEIIEADSIISTVPHFVLPTLFEEYSLFDFLKEMPATTVATVAMAFPEEVIDLVIDGTGFVVSRNSNFTITACTWTHKKWPHTTPKGKVLLRCYVGRAGEEDVVEKSDEEIKTIVLQDLEKIMRIHADPEFTVITRWRQAMPQYTVGHKERINLLKKEMEKQLPGIYIAGGSFDGLGIPDCIDQGEKAVTKVLRYHGMA